MKKITFLTFCILLLAGAASAELVTGTVSYQQGDTTMQGYLAFDDSFAPPRPGVLVVHEWWGLNDYARYRTEQLARLGYVAFAADMYGQGAVTRDPEEAGTWSGHLRGSPLLRQRARAALDVLKKQDRVDPGRLGAIGFCFGGTTVLELAYSGADLAGVVSFHGGLTAPESPGQVRARFLVLHGADDPFVSFTEIEEYQQAMRKADLDWQMIIYGGAQHSFSNPAADQLELEGIDYHEKVAARAWKHMQLFLDELFFP